MARRLVERLAILELVPNVLARALDPLPAPVRALDALHLASIELLKAGARESRSRAATIG